MSTNKAVVALNGELKGDREEFKKLIGEKDIFFIAADGGTYFLKKHFFSIYYPHFQPWLLNKCRYSISKSIFQEKDIG